MSIRGKAAITGYAELPARRDYGERTSVGLMAEVTRKAIVDAGLRKEDIDGLVTGQEGHMHFAEAIGLTPRFETGMVQHGAAPASGIVVAAAAVATGLANHILCAWGGNTPPSRMKLLGANIATGRGGGGPANVGTEWEAPYGPVIGGTTAYALIKRRHMHLYGTKQEQFAKCAVDERWNGAQNPDGIHYGKPVTIEDVLSSRWVGEPLHLLECVMPVSAAHAVIVSSAERARSLPNPPAYILGAGGPATRYDTPAQAAGEITDTPVSMTAPLALSQAGYSIRDIEFCEFYDCYTAFVMTALEDAGVCPKGEIGDFYESTDTTFKGQFPINTDGGQIGSGQTTGTGMRHVVEAARQIMGRAGERQVTKHDLCLVNGNGGGASVEATIVVGSANAL